MSSQATASKVVVQLQSLASHARQMQQARSLAINGLNKLPDRGNRPLTVTFSTANGQQQQPSTVRPSTTWKVKSIRERSGSTVASAIAHEPVSLASQPSIALWLNQPFIILHTHGPCRHPLPCLLEAFPISSPFRRRLS